MTVANRRRFRARRTTYKGIEFRSRLESRWARAFDRAEIPWLYEPECFADPDTYEEYLPDFRLDRGASVGPTSRSSRP